MRRVIPECDWKYGRSLRRLEEYIVDDIIKDNENSFEGDSACISLLNVSTAQRLFEAWENFAYKNEAALIEQDDEIESLLTEAKGIIEEIGESTEDDFSSEQHLQDMNDAMAQY